jgi:Ran GTPase-activating protein (RanGAP) involved in mRNA processing and transport
MKVSSCLQKLNLSQFPQVIDPKPLADGLMGSKLIELDLSDNRLSHTDALVTALHENQTLHTLNLSRIRIDDDENNDNDDDSHSKSENSTTNASTFLVHLGNTQGLKVLLLDDVEFSTEMMNELAQSLRINKSLESLHLENMEDCLSWQSFLESLHDNTTLKKLKIGQNRFNESDMKMLVAALCVNQSLRSLTLSGCSLTDDDLVILGEKLPEMQGLEDLDLCFNSFGAKGVMALWQGLLSNYKLQRMTLFNSSWSVGGPENFLCDGYAEENERIQELLQRNRYATITSTSQADGKHP